MIRRVGGPPQKPFPYGDYRKLKEKGLAKITNMGGTAAIIQKQFDPNTAEPIGPKRTAVKREQLEDIKKQLDECAISVDMMLEDLEAVEAEIEAEAAEEKVRLEAALAEKLSEDGSSPSEEPKEE
jgi:hypothetical protein